MPITDTARVFADFFASDERLNPLLEALYQKMGEGHLCLDLEDDLSEDSPLVGSIEQTDRPFIVHGKRLYTGRFFHYESRIVEKLQELARAEAVPSFREEVVEHIRRHIQSKDTHEEVAAFSDAEKPDWQLVAAVTACTKRLCLITGGPGTGKTTTVAKILSILNQQQPGQRIELAAPTGKAAVRMKESLIKSAENHPGLGIEQLVKELKPKTIHRLLGANFQSPFFKSNRQHPLEADVLIVDECSMIGAALFAKMLDALHSNTRLILLGDSNQLSSVESGSVFGDLCALTAETENRFDADTVRWLNAMSREDRLLSDRLVSEGRKTCLDGHVVRLHKTYRYDSTSAIGRLTASINAGNEEAVQEYLQNPDEQLSIYHEYPSRIIEEFAGFYEDYLTEPNIDEALKKLNKTRILCAVRETLQGVKQHNLLVEAHLKKRFKDHPRVIFRPSATDFYHNQPILVTQNLNELDLFNGDVGIVREAEGKKMAYFPCTGEENEYGRISDTLKAIHPGLITHWETVFAMTIHKSQGSEFERVLVVLPKKTDHRLLTRELVYTAITRGKKGGKVVVEAGEGVIVEAIRGRISRISGIADRLTNHSA